VNIVGLSGRRAIKEFQDHHLPELKQKIDQTAGFEVALEVEWETIAIADQTQIYNECWTQIYFSPLIAAFTSICQDELGRTALKSALKQVVIQNTGGIYYGDRWATFNDGVLILDHEPTTNAADIEERTQGLIKVLEKSL
jgi:hypothetical protein